MAILYNLVGGVSRSRNGQQTRGAIHVLIGGDPETGKSQLLRSAERMVDNSTWIMGTGLNDDLQETRNKGDAK